MGRRPIGERALTNAEKQTRKYRQKRSAQKTKGAKIKDKEWHDPEQYKEFKRKDWEGCQEKKTKKSCRKCRSQLFLEVFKQGKEQFA